VALIHGLREAVHDAHVSEANEADDEGKEGDSRESGEQFCAEGHGDSFSFVKAAVWDFGLTEAEKRGKFSAISAKLLHYPIGLSRKKRYWTLWREYARARAFAQGWPQR
jgi:hypothetical protein